MAGVAYSEAKEAERIGRELIDSEHRRLAGVPVRYLFRDKTKNDRGAEVWGEAKKISGLPAYLSRPHAEAPQEDYFVIELAEPVWAILTEDQKRALIDHELSHLDRETAENGDVKLVLNPHDCEEFVGVIERHGLWRESVKALLAAAGGAAQVELAFEDREPVPVGGPAAAEALRRELLALKNQGAEVSVHLSPGRPQASEASAQPNGAASFTEPHFRYHGGSLRHRLPVLEGGEVPAYALCGANGGGSEWIQATEGAICRECEAKAEAVSS